MDGKRYGNVTMPHCAPRWLMSGAYVLGCCPYLMVGKSHAKQQDSSTSSSRCCKQVLKILLMVCCPVCRSVCMPPVASLLQWRAPTCCHPSWHVCTTSWVPPTCQPSFLAWPQLSWPCSQVRTCHLRYVTCVLCIVQSARWLWGGFFWANWQDVRHHRSILPHNSGRTDLHESM